jgi:hypothetical protein
VVTKLLQHKKHGVGLVLLDAVGGALSEPSIAPLLAGVSRTRCGALMLPDKSAFGPLYWAVIERRAPAEGGDDDDEEDDEASSVAERLRQRGLGSESEDDLDDDDDDESGSGEDAEGIESEPVELR